MLKGQVFKEQIFENQIFAVFINTFLAGKNGIINGYKNSMRVTSGNNSVTIQSGCLCVQGRFLEEDIGTTIATDTDTAFCSLVVEIDLDKVNTDLDFTQGYYRILKSANGYPSLTQENIVNTNSGVYQYELARFKTSLNGISDFVDLRNFLDYQSLYDEISQKLNEVEDGSIYLLKREFEETYKKQLDNMHPIGSIYMSIIETNPSEYFGGTWVQIAKGRTLIGVNEDDSDFSKANLQGGEKKHQLTIDEMPSHSHSYQRYNYYTANIDPAPGGNGREPNQAISNHTTGTTGGNKAHNILQPYLTCYIWQRTA